MPSNQPVGSMDYTMYQVYIYYTRNFIFVEMILDL